MLKGFIFGIFIWALLLAEITITVKENTYKWEGIRHYLKKENNTKE
jgi:hypothetical protein